MLGIRPSSVAALTIEAPYIDWTTVLVAGLAAVCMAGHLVLLGRQGRQVLGALHNRLLGIGDWLGQRDGPGNGTWQRRNGELTWRRGSDWTRRRSSSWAWCRLLDVNVFRFGCGNVLRIGSLCGRVGQLCGSRAANQRQNDEHEEFLPETRATFLKYTLILRSFRFILSSRLGANGMHECLHSSPSVPNEAVHLSWGALELSSRLSFSHKVYKYI